MAVAALIVFSCKKETKEVISDPPDSRAPSVNGNYTICNEDNWANDGDIQDFESDLVAVYNNKSYFFHNNAQLSPTDSRRNKIRIYDGTNWEVKSSGIPFDPTYIGFAFVIGNKGYFGYTTYVGSSSHGDTWQYNFTTNAWSSTEDFPDYYLSNPAYFTVNNKGYVVGGIKGSFNSYYTWEFDPSASPKWKKKANLPGVGRLSSVGFTIDTKGYVAAGITSLPYPYADVYHKALFQYNPSNDTWAIKADFPGEGRESAKAFATNGKGYVGGGYTRDGNDFNYFYDFYQYNPYTNNWSRVDNYGTGGQLRECFSINSKGYAVWKPNSDVFFDPLKLKKYTPSVCTTIPGGPTVP